MQHWLYQLLSMSRLVALTFFTLIFLQGCSRRVTPSASTAKPLDIEEIDFEYFHGKARINFTDEKKAREVKATIRVRKDSVIWMDISVVGVSGARALINKDSITIRSNVDKEYYVFEFTELSKRFNFEINYSIIQAAMFGNLISSRLADDEITSDGTFSIVKQNRGTIHILNFVNAASNKIERVELSESNSNNSLKMLYRNFQPVGPKIFPYNGVITVLYKTAAGVMNNTIEFEYSKAEVGDRELRFPFNIPKKYQRR
jgi:hypothetical protein